MASSGLKLGRLVPEPERFKPTQTIVGARYIYRLDLEQGICHRRPKHWDDEAPAGYYQLITGTGSEPSPNGTWAMLRQTIVVPTLVATLVAGIFLVVYPLLPGLTYRVQKQLGSFNNSTAVAAPDPTHNQIVIPKIGVDTTIWEGPSLSILNHHDGVWHQTGDISSNFVIAGHRFKYLPPNTSTFYNLGQLKVGDVIIVDWYGTRHIYDVTQTKQIDQNDTSILKPTATAQITVYTCYDMRQTQRIVVIGQPEP